MDPALGSPSRSITSLSIQNNTSPDSNSRNATPQSLRKPKRRILCLDGGGIRGISTLLILQKLMETIRDLCGLDETPAPHLYFHLIGGTSTGGIIAIMLGPLRMTVAQCLKAYRVMAERAFTPIGGGVLGWIPQLPAPPGGTFSGESLADAVRDIVQEYTGDRESLFANKTCCKTVVLAVTKVDVGAFPTKFRTYSIGDDFRACKIWEVARATSAATTFFPSISCGEQGIEFIDAGFGHNNPAEILLSEAEDIFDSQDFDCVLSIGTGLNEAVSLEDSRLSILGALKKMATSSEAAHRRLARRLSEDVYFRFDVVRGLSDITLSDWEKSSRISAHTANYLAEFYVERSINKCARILTQDNMSKAGVFPISPSISEIFRPSQSGLITPSQYSTQNYHSVLPAGTYVYPPLPHQGPRSMAKKTSSFVPPNSESLKESIENVFIAVMGTSGSGKSSFISHCTKQSNTIGHSLRSCTKGVEISSFMWNNHIRVHMIDVPGFDHTERSDGEIFRYIAGWMTMAYEKNTNLSGIIYLHRITDHRMTGSSMRNLSMFKELCGSKCFSEVTLVLTCLDRVDPAIGVAREHELTTSEQFWGSMVKQGSRVARYSHSRDSAMSIVDSVVERQRMVVLDVQDEMVNRRLRLDETAAGKFMSRDFLNQRNKFQQKIRELQDEMRVATNEKDQKWAREIDQEHEDLHKQIDQGDQQMRDLRMSFENLKWEREQEYEKIGDEISQRAAEYKTKK